MNAANLEHDRKVTKELPKEDGVIENQVMAVILQAKQHKNKEAYEQWYRSKEH